DDRPVAGPIGARFPVGLAALEVDVEHVQLVVAGDDPARRIEQEGAVRDPLRLDLDGQRAGKEPSTRLARQIPERGQRIVSVLRLRLVEDPAPPRLQHADILGRQDEIGAGIARTPDQFGDLPHAVADLRLRRILDAGDRKALRHLPSPRIESSLPARSRAWRSSQPPTWRPSMKICGTVRRPPARSIISARRAGSASTSISVKATPLDASSRFARWQNGQNMLE